MRWHRRRVEPAPAPEPEPGSSRWVREFVTALGDAPLIEGKRPQRCPVCPALVWPSALYRFGSVSHVSCARTLRATGRAAVVDQMIRDQGDGKDDG